MSMQSRQSDLRSRAMSGIDYADRNSGEAGEGDPGLTPTRMPAVAPQQQARTAQQDSPDVPATPATQPQQGGAADPFAQMMETASKVGGEFLSIFRPSRTIVDKDPNFQDVMTGLGTGDLTGLEMIDFGHVRGHPAIGWTDKDGRKHVMRMSESNWLAAIDHRTKARAAFAEQVQKKQATGRAITVLNQIEAMTPGQFHPTLFPALKALAPTDPEGVLKIVGQLSIAQAKDGGKSLALDATMYTQEQQRESIRAGLLGREREVPKMVDSTDEAGKRVKVEDPTGATETVRVGGRIKDVDTIIAKARGPNANDDDRLRAYDVQSIEDLIVDPRATRSFGAIVGFFDANRMDTGSEFGKVRQLMRIAKDDKEDVRVPSPGELTRQTLARYAADLNEYAMSVFGWPNSDPHSAIELVVQALQREGRIPGGTGDPFSQQPEQSAPASSGAAPSAKQKQQAEPPANQLRSSMQDFLRRAR